MLPEYHEVTVRGITTLVCNECGKPRVAGDWPDCRKDGSHSAGSFGEEPLEPYVDEHLTQDPNGVLITTRSQRTKLMDKHALVYHKNKYITNGRRYVDLGRR